MIRPAGVTIGLILQLGCGWLSDPAVRFAYCVERAVKQLPRDAAMIRSSCDLKLPGNYVVVLHPEGALREEQLASAGLPQALLPELRVLRLADQPAIYVMATGAGVSGTGSERSPRSSWTTNQMNFVQIDRLMVLVKTTQPVKVDIGGTAERRVIAGLH